MVIKNKNITFISTLYEHIDYLLYLDLRRTYGVNLNINKRIREQLLEHIVLKVNSLCIQHRTHPDPLYPKTVNVGIKISKSIFERKKLAEQFRNLLSLPINGLTFTYDAYIEGELGLVNHENFKKNFIIPISKNNELNSMKFMGNYLHGYYKILDVEKDEFRDSSHLLDLFIAFYGLPSEFLPEFTLELTRRIDLDRKGQWRVVKNKRLLHFKGQF